MKIIAAEIKHIEAVVDIFCAAFSRSIMFFTPLNSAVKRAFRDFFMLLRDTFNGGFMVAVDGNEVCGYIVMADDIKRLWLRAIFSGFLFKIFLKAIGGIYGVGLSTIYRVVKNKLCYMKFEVTTRPSAQLLSIAVAPEHHGRGIGKKLLEAGLKYMASLGVRRVKLEVRPDNAPAVRIYEKYGFKPAGKTRDLQGDWLIMVKEL
ncbi:GNAT family N-acetyltransferase [Thermosediminibacter litoriperuensis]|uniref:Ribosomal protein S18 acetylase RimI-like enzyme n=1 Tax=Thermosediminibacter litoriperuensis TaxID=291989 RepID=A0A5S5AME9_9FIRM|nr:GNAT family N-acetyltransferase [Thermosediminibacter litoriperuensis]TYP52510.1 ribosomal protein S18 acetylase RimI-like enzyme [Thermosediminibacter litoriperuensis]